MWRLREIKANNIVSFKKLHLNLKQNVCTVIYGENLDNDKQKNNGSGKSSIVEAIAFGITGDSIKKAPSINDIINDMAEEMFVSLSFENDYDSTQFVIERTASREGAQKIACYKFDANGTEIEQDKTVQASVLEYNRFIMDELGVTKDELYTCYILNNNRFKSFFQASDREKKEIINNFSNGVLVDQAIESLDVDIASVSERLTIANNEVLKQSSAIEALGQQILNAEENQLNAEEEKKARLVKLEQDVAVEREKIRQSNEAIEAAKSRLHQITSIKDWLVAAKNADGSISNYPNIVKMFEDCGLPQIKDYDATAERYKAEITKIETDAAADKKCVSEFETLMAEVAETCDKAKQAYDAAQRKYNDKADKYAELLSDVQNLIKEIKADTEQDMKDLNEYTSELQDIQSEARRLKVQISGAVECPNCHYKFSLEANTSVEDMEAQLKELQSDEKATNKKLAEIKRNLQEDEEDADKAKQKEAKYVDGRNAEFAKVQKLFDELTAQQNKAKDMERECANLKQRWEVWKVNKSDIQRKVEQLGYDMFCEAEKIVDASLAKGDAYVESKQSAITASEGIIEALNSTKEDVRKSQSNDVILSLEKSKKEYEEALIVAKDKQQLVQNEYQKFDVQKDSFLRFKSHLANKKIDSIAEQVNSFLEQIGSDMRIELSGFKVTKTKKVREKITMTILRDGVDGGAFEKFSGGERARIVLAGILAMRHLINMNCDNGKGLDFLILDEILDASDYSGLMSYAETLTNLGITTLLITQGSVSESYPHQLIVRKEQGFSSII